MKLFVNRYTMLFILPAIVVIGWSNGVYAGSTTTEQSMQTVTIGVGGLTNLHNVPLIVAQQKQFFARHGIKAKLLDLHSGSMALQALMSGSVDVAAGFYDHAIQMAARGRSLQSFVVLSTSPGAVLAVSPNTSKHIKSFEDLKGTTIGVTSLGSGSDFFLREVLSKADIPVENVTIVGIGSGNSAVVAMKAGQVDAAFMYEPAFSSLVEQSDSHITILADMRKPSGVKAVLGSSTYPSEVLYAKESWLDDHKKAAVGVAHSTIEALRWMHKHSAAEITKLVPSDLRSGSDEFYTHVLSDSIKMFSKDGMMPNGGPQVNLNLLSGHVKRVSSKSVTLGDTYTNSYAQ